VYDDSRWLLMLQNCLQLNFNHFMLIYRCRNFWKGRSWSRTFYIWLHNPGRPPSQPHTFSALSGHL